MQRKGWKVEKSLSTFCLPAQSRIMGRVQKGQCQSWGWGKCGNGDNGRKLPKHNQCFPNVQPQVPVLTPGSCRHACPFTHNIGPLFWGFPLPRTWQRPLGRASTMFLLASERSQGWPGVALQALGLMVAIKVPSPWGSGVLSHAAHCSQCPVTLHCMSVTQR